MGKNAILLALLLACPAVRAVTPGQADSALASVNAVYWNPTSIYFHKSDQKAGRLDFWMSAHAWETLLEAYQRTGQAAYRKQITDMYDGFVKYFGSDWTTNDYNDDIMWWALACARVYQVTGEKRYLDQAKKHFDWVMTTQSDTVFGGGIWWRNDEHKTKNSCIVQPAIITAVYLSQILGEASYRAKAESLYAWQKRTLTETTGKVYDAINFNGLGKGSTTYNQGTFIGSAQLLGHIADAEKAADWTRANLSDANGVLKNTQQSDFGTFSQILVRYVMKMARRPGGERYLVWMETNATAVWKNRRTKDGIMGFNWAAAAPDTGIQCQSAFGGVTLLNLLATPDISVVRDRSGPGVLAGKSSGLSWSRGALEFPGHGILRARSGANYLSLDGRRLRPE